MLVACPLFTCLLRCPLFHGSQGELTVLLREARGLPVWGFPGQSNPYVRVSLGEQAVVSRRDCDTSHAGRYRAPVWNQEIQFLVEDAGKQVGEASSLRPVICHLSSHPSAAARVWLWCFHD